MKAMWNFMRKLRSAAGRLEPPPDAEGKIDLIELTREHVVDHDRIAWKNLKAFRAELNGDSLSLARLRAADVRNEMWLGQKLFAAMLNENGQFYCRPQVLVAGFEGHAARLEARGSFYNTVATLLAAATAVWSVDGARSWHLIAMGAVFIFVTLVVKLKNDEYIAIIRRVIAHLESFDAQAPCE